MQGTPTPTPTPTPDGGPQLLGMPSVLVVAILAGTAVVLGMAYLEYHREMRLLDAGYYDDELRADLQAERTRRRRNLVLLVGFVALFYGLARVGQVRLGPVEEVSPSSIATLAVGLGTVVWLLIWLLLSDSSDVPDGVEEAAEQALEKVEDIDDEATEALQKVRSINEVVGGALETVEGNDDEGEDDDDEDEADDEEGEADDDEDEADDEEGETDDEEGEGDDEEGETDDEDNDDDVDDEDDT